MNCWEAARKVAELLQSHEPEEILNILNGFPFEQRRFIISIKYAYSSLLFVAVKRKHVSFVRYFLDNCGADPNSIGWRHKEKLTCLCLAVMLNSEAIVNILLEHGADTELLSSSRKAPLHYACRNGRLKMVTQLIEHGAKLYHPGCPGKSCLIESLDHLYVCEYLLSVSENVNLAEIFQSIPMAYGYKNEKKRVISSLLNHKNTNVRLQTHLQEDVLHFAVACFSRPAVDDIVTRGSYTNNEVIKVYEIQSSILYISSCVEMSKELWKIAKLLNSESETTPIFRNPHPPGKLQEVSDCFNDDHVAPLLYLESVYGLEHIPVLQAFAFAICKVCETDKFIVLYNHFFNRVHSFGDECFFLAYHQIRLIMNRYFELNIVHKKLQAMIAFERIVRYILEIRTRFERMTPQERTPHSDKVETILRDVLRIIQQFDQFYHDNMYPFKKGICHILQADLRSFDQKSLLHFSAYDCQSSRVLGVLLQCGADVNSTDAEGKTVLHDFMEIQNVASSFVKTIIGSGFDFKRNKCNEYCLACRLESEGVLPHVVKHKTLQCLAAKVFCETSIKCFADIPRHLMPIINSHMHLLDGFYISLR